MALPDRLWPNYLVLGCPHLLHVLNVTPCTYFLLWTPLSISRDHRHLFLWGKLDTGASDAGAGGAGPAPDIEVAEEGVTIKINMSRLRNSMPNNDPGAEMGCTTPGAVGAGAMEHSMVAAVGHRPGCRIGACPSRFGRRINGCFGPDVDGASSNFFLGGGICVSAT